MHWCIKMPVAPGQLWVCQLHTGLFQKSDRLDALDGVVHVLCRSPAAMVGRLPYGRSDGFVFVANSVLAKSVGPRWRGSRVTPRKKLAQVIQRADEKRILQHLQ
jgi:hypothetical protein